MNQVVLVEWEDCHTDNDWKSIDQIERIADEKNALLMLSVGYLLLDKEDYVVIASTFSEPTSSETKALANGTTQIPRSAIRKMTKIPNARKR